MVKWANLSEITDIRSEFMFFFLVKVDILFISNANIVPPSTYKTQVKL